MASAALVLGLIAGLVVGVQATPAGQEPSPVEPLVIVSDDEPGEALLLQGTVFAADGETPLGGVRVHVHQTNREGRYTRLGSAGDGERIAGEFVTGADGRYAFRTIRPASYPGNGPAAHVHYQLSGPEGRRQGATLHFTGDERLSAAQVRRAASQGRFATIQPLRQGEDGMLYCTFDIRMGD